MSDCKAVNVRRRMLLVYQASLTSIQAKSELPQHSSSSIGGFSRVCIASSHLHPIAEFVVKFNWK